ncbi:MAG: hypothetical protein GF317_20925 [Candidatus Lokiarchaeota archaeon]|nr:hypothetical protein [Candidatus Lokiarchaeota archaeon]MBD3201909.1 hypothetical protein [Candidatus Lokiarchaeota archaeon]
MVLLKKIDNQNKIFPQIFTPIGMLSLVVAILLYQFGPDYGFLAFIEGLLFGISMIFLLFSLVYTSRMQRVQHNKDSE